MKEIEQLDDSTKNGIIRWIIDFINDAYTASGKIDGRKPDIDNLLNLLKRDLPEGLKKNSRGAAVIELNKS